MAGAAGHVPAAAAADQPGPRAARAQVLAQARAGRARTVRVERGRPGEVALVRRVEARCGAGRPARARPRTRADDIARRASARPREVRVRREYVRSGHRVQAPPREASRGMRVELSDAL